MHIRWGIVGLGQLIMEWIAPAILSSPKDSLVACADVDNARVMQFCTKFNLTRAYSSYEELTKDPDVDAIYVATPNALHCPVVLAAAFQGKHILCQKPMALTAKDAEEMIVACRDAGVLLRIGLQLRFDRALQEIAKLVRHGKVGEVKEVTAQRFAPIHEAKAWRHDLKIAGGGALLDVGTHVVDFFQWIVGDRIREVFSFASPERSSGRPDDTAVVLTTFEGGCIGTIRCSRELPIGANNLQIFGTKGMITTGPLRWANTHTIWLQTEETSEEREFPVENLYDREIEAFGLELEGDRTAMATGEEGLQLVRLFEGIIRSLESKKSQSLWIVMM